MTERKPAQKKEPRKVQRLNQDHIAQMERMKETTGWEDWAPCQICGLPCPYGKYEQAPDFHLTCAYGQAGQRFVKARAREQKRELVAVNKPQLF